MVRAGAPDNLQDCVAWRELAALHRPKTGLLLAFPGLLAAIRGLDVSVLTIPNLSLSCTCLAGSPAGSAEVGRPRAAPTGLAASTLHTPIW